MASRTPVSIVIPTRNEALQIGECVRGLAWAEEVIVVGGGSADGTAEPARAAGARVLNGARAGPGGGRSPPPSKAGSPPAGPGGGVSPAAGRALAPRTAP